jgi:hypothetical protein
MAPETARKKRGKRVDLDSWLESIRPDRIGESQFDELRRALAPVSQNYLRKLLRDSGVPLTPMVEGVRQGNLDELHASLVALLDEYEKGDPARKTAVRRLVIAAKDHARWASRRPEKKAGKQEMILWIVTWLENPPVFPEWAKLRRARLGSGSA